MKEKKKLRLNVISVKSFVTALDQQELNRIDAGASADCDDTIVPCGRSSDRVYLCCPTDSPCDSNGTCVAAGCIGTMERCDGGPPPY